MKAKTHNLRNWLRAAGTAVAVLACAWPATAQINITNVPRTNYAPADAYTLLQVGRLTRTITLSNLLNSLTNLTTWPAGNMATNAFESSTTSPGLTIATNSRLYTFTLNAALSALATNNGTGLTNITVTGGSLSNLYDVYNAKSYGAVGNGVADDAPAIRATIAAAAASATARGRIYIPAGTYMLASNDALTDQGVKPLIKLTSNIEVIGDPGRTILKVANTVAQWEGTIFTTDYGKTNIILRNLILDGNRDGRGLSASFYSSDNLIDLRATGECYLSDILAMNGPHAAFDFAWGTNIIGERLIAKSCGGSGFTLTGDKQTLRDSIAIYCGHNQATADVDRRWGAGLQVAYEAKNVLVDNFRSISNYTGANIIRTHGITIKNSVFVDGSTNYLIKVWLPTVIGTGAGTSHDIQLENNRFNKVDGAQYGVWIQTGPSSGTNKQVSVRGNDFENCQLLIDNSPEVVVANNTWQRFNSELVKGLVSTNGARILATGNRFNWPGDFGITVYSGSNHISGNYFNNSYASIGVVGNSNYVIGNVVQSPEATSFYSLYVSGSTNFIGMNYFEQAIRLVGSTAHGNTFMANVFPKVTDDSAAAAGNKWILNEVSSFDGTFADNNTNGHVLTIKTNGFIGMGTNTPAYRLTVAGEVAVTDEAYNATTWNGNGTVPTKNAIRDKIESMSGGGGGGQFSGGFTNGSGAITADGHAMELIDPNTGWTNLNWTDQTLSTANTNVLDWFNKRLIGPWTIDAATLTGSTIIVSNSVTGDYTQIGPGGSILVTNTLTSAAASITNGTFYGTLAYPTNLAFAGHTNVFLLANRFSDMVASSDVAITNIGGALGGYYTWGTINVSNSQATNITVRTYSNAVAPLRIQGPSSTNALVIGPGKEGMLSYWIRDVKSTNYVTTSQQ